MRFSKCWDVKAILIQSVCEQALLKWWYHRPSIFTEIYASQTRWWDEGALPVDQFYGDLHDAVSNVFFLPVYLYVCLFAVVSVRNSTKISLDGTTQRFQDISRISPRSHEPRVIKTLYSGNHFVLKSKLRPKNWDNKLPYCDYESMLPLGKIKISRFLCTYLRGILGAMCNLSLPSLLESLNSRSSLIFH